MGMLCAYHAFHRSSDCLRDKHTRSLDQCRSMHELSNATSLCTTMRLKASAPGQPVRQELGLGQRLQDAHEAVVQVMEEVLMIADLKQDRWPVHPAVAPAQQIRATETKRRYDLPRHD